MAVPRQGQPSGGLLTRSHSMARGIRGAWRVTGQADLNDYGSYKHSTTKLLGSGATITSIGSPYGMAGVWNNAATYANYVVPDHISLRPALPVTFGVLYKITSSSAVSGLANFNGYVSGVDGFYGCHLKVTTTRTLDLWHGDGQGVFNNAVRRFVTNETIDLDTWHMTVARMSGPTDMEIITNGLSMTGTYSGIGTGLGYAPSRNSYIGSGAVNSAPAELEPLLGQMAMLYWWGAGLSTAQMRMLCVDPYLLLRHRRDILSGVPISYASMIGEIGMASATAGSLIVLQLMSATIQNAILMQSGLDVPLSVVSAIVNAASISGSLLAPSEMASNIVFQLTQGGDLKAQAFLAGTMQLGVGLTGALVGVEPALPFIQSLTQRFDQRIGGRIASHTNRRAVTESLGLVEVQDLSTTQVLNGNTLYIKRRI